MKWRQLKGITRHSRGGFNLDLDIVDVISLIMKFIDNEKL